MTKKRVLTSAALIVLLLVLSVVAVFALTFMGLKTVVDGFETNGVRIVEDGSVTVGVVPAGEGRVALIDAGNDETGQAILAELSRRGLSRENVSHILLTHGHPDHIAAIGLFPNAEILALDAEVPLIEGRTGARGPLPRLFPVRPTGVKVGRPLRDGETVTVGDVSVRVFAVPGHTEGSAAYLVNGVLFVGDSANVTSDGEIEGALWIFSDSQSENRASLVALGQRLTPRGTDVAAIAPSHSGVLADGLGALNRFAAEHR